MSKATISKDAQIKKLARELVRDSIIEDAASRFVEMVLKEVHDSRIKPLHDRIESLEAKLAKAVEAFEQCEIMLRLRGHDAVAAIARSTIAELEGEK